MNYIILDLEATCWREGSLKKPNEIIEIGAVQVNEQGEITDEFAEFVRPILNPELSVFCRELTTITQAEIDTADTFDQVLERFIDWINPQEEYLLCSWGFYDKSQLTKDCQLHQLSSDWLAPHISVKHQYAAIKQLKRPIGMDRALKEEGLNLEGTHHRGIDDARNIAKIFLQYFGQWKVEE